MLSLSVNRKWLRRRKVHTRLHRVICAGCSGTPQMCLQQKPKEFLSFIGMKKLCISLCLKWPLGIRIMSHPNQRHTAAGAANGKLVGQANWNKNTKITTWRWETMSLLLVSLTGCVYIRVKVSEWDSTKMENLNVTWLLLRFWIRLLI